MNRLPLARRTQVINCLVEGNSIRSTERMTDTHRDTIMRLMVEVGQGCAALANEQMRDLSCERIQVDEIWSYVRMKQARIPRGTAGPRLAINGRSLRSMPIPSWFRPIASASERGKLPSPSLPIFPTV
jgi:hypothetical protein